MTSSSLRDERIDPHGTDGSGGGGSGSSSSSSSRRRR